MTVRPTPEQVLSLAPGTAAAAAAVAVADQASWSAAGHDEHGVWGRYLAAAAEPYEVAVDLRGPAYRCTCPSRRLPCKHGLGLLLLFAQQHVVVANRLPFADEWLRQRDVTSVAEDSAGTPDAVAQRDGGHDAVVTHVRATGRVTPPRTPVADLQREQRRLARAERMRVGLSELDHWVTDRVRAGLAAPELADPATWDLVAARLVDAQCGALANRVKRVATAVGQHTGWHEEVLDELAMLHALSVAARRTSMLPETLADGVHVATGLTVAKDDVLAGVPSTAAWLVMGESRTREDRITVQRTWLRAQHDGMPDTSVDTWAMVLAFGAFGNEVATEYPVGHVLHADLHWYPGGIPLRALVGHIHCAAVPATTAPRGSSIDDAIAAAGWASAGEPWLERWAMCVTATPAPLGNGRWALSDSTGSIPIVPGFWRLAELVAESGGSPITLAGEWSVDGFLPLTLWVGAMAVAL